MNSRFQTKSDLYIFFGYVFIALALVINPLAFILWKNWGLIPPVSPEFMHNNDLAIALPAFAATLLGLLGGLMLRAPKTLSHYFNNTLWFNLVLFGLLLGIFFSSNPIMPGNYRLLRILLVLTLLFFLTNSLYLAVVRDAERRHIHPFYRNLGLSIYTVLLVLFVLEIIFMFVLGTHRFNGTLSSRAWFLKNWHLNAEGYRDSEIDTTSLSTKKKVLVLGDSFVAGHGVKDPADRFSDRLGAKLPSTYQVLNLGVGGSDVADASTRLSQYPLKPDLLIFSYYPNDIEQDGQRAGLRLQKAQSYTDVAFPFRYLIRRSYVLNHLYWRFPHPSELTDYKGYLRQCYTYSKVKALHRRHLDNLIHQADSLHIPMVVVVFPFLEDAKGSDFATVPIVTHFRSRGIEVLDVRAWLLGKDPAEFIVNNNDPHPNEHMHAMVADSLYGRLLTKGYITKD